MKLTAEDYRRNYAQMSDEEFLAINRDDLVELARRSYDAELARRQLTAPPVDEEPPPAEEEHPHPVHEDYSDIPPEPPPFPPHEETVQLAVIVTGNDARYALRTLHRANVPAFLTETPAITGNYAEHCLGLLVPASCAEAARDLLAGQLGWNNRALVRQWFEKDWTPDDVELNDLEVTVDEYFGEENKVAARITVTGFDPRSKKRVKLCGIAIVHLEDSKIGEHWIHLKDAEP
jgi:hypothetical protein